MPEWERAYRIISSAFPPIAVFEDVLDPADLELAFLIEGMTNDRLRDQAGVISRVQPEDRVSGPGSTSIMAAFTHIGMASRFTDGTYGVYYCADSLKVAVAETRFHAEQFLAATNEPSIELTMRCYINAVEKPLHDIRQDHEHLHGESVLTYPPAQQYAKVLRESGSWGLLYNSVRRAGGECAAVFRPPALSMPVQGPHLRYFWDGHTQKIDVMQLQLVV